MKRILTILLVGLALGLPAAPVFASCSCYDPDDGTASSPDGDSYCSSWCTEQGYDGGTDDTTNDEVCACGGGTSLPYESCTDFCESLGLLDEPPTSDAGLSSVEEVKDPVVPQLNVDIPGLSFSEPLQEGGMLKSNFIADYVSAVYKYLLGAGVVIAIVFIMVAGLQYTMAAGTGDTAKAKARIRNSVVGLVLLFCVYVILYTVNPQLTIFRSLSIAVIQREEIDNETPADFVSEFETVSTPGNGGAGWNGVPMFDQKAYQDVAYGPENCKTEDSGNVKSSGCGVTSFAMVVSSLGSRITPDQVAATFWAETESGVGNFRPVCSDGCGCQGTSSEAFTKSSLVAQNNLKSRYINTGDTGQILDLLSQGKLIIVSYRTNRGGGHYVVLTGIDENGDLLINNPWGGAAEKTEPENLFPALKSATYIDRAEDFIPG